LCSFIGLNSIIDLRSNNVRVDFRLKLYQFIDSSSIKKQKMNLWPKEVVIFPSNNKALIGTDSDQGFKKD
jgi:hypothetical protein